MVKIKNRFLVRIAAYGFARAMSALFSTVQTEFRTKVENTNPYQVSGPTRYFYAVWHDSMILPVFAGKQRQSVALTSEHRDGSFVAQVLRTVGIAPCVARPATAGRVPCADSWNQQKRNMLSSRQMVLEGRDVK